MVPRALLQHPVGELEMEIPPPQPHAQRQADPVSGFRADRFQRGAAG
jgi:hypothetical protein